MAPHEKNRPLRGCRQLDAGREAFQVDGRSLPTTRPELTPGRVEAEPNCQASWEREALTTREAHRATCARQRAQSNLLPILSNSQRFRMAKLTQHVQKAAGM